jgi:hypothetical protein
LDFDKRQKPSLVFEEYNGADETDEPAKFDGFREGVKSADIGSHVPNYGLLIYDVSNFL